MFTRMKMHSYLSAAYSVQAVVVQIQEKVFQDDKTYVAIAVTDFSCDSNVNQFI